MLIKTLDLFRGKKKLEKALQQSQHDIMSLTEKLLRVQNGKMSIFCSVFVKYLVSFLNLLSWKIS